MLYELRHYIAVAGREAELRTRFAEHVLPIMRRHGLVVHAFWESADDSGQLWYVMAWRDAAEMVRLWAEFRGDSEWLAYRAASETDGSPIAASTSMLLRRPEFFQPFGRTG